MGLVIDTSALVSLEKGRISGAGLPFGREPLVLPGIVWAEALIGVYLADTPERATRRRGFLEKIHMLVSIEPFGAEAAEHYAALYAELRKRGVRIPQNGLQVASVAISLGYGVLARERDEQHFRQIPNLRVECLA